MCFQNSFFYRSNWWSFFFYDAVFWEHASLFNFSQHFYVLELPVFFDGIFVYVCVCVCGGGPFLGCEFDHSPSANTEGKNIWSCTFTFLYAFIVCTGTSSLLRACGGIVVKAPCYKPAGDGFDSGWCHWNFSVTWSFRSHYGPGVDSASNRNEYQVYFLGVKAAGA